MPFDITYHMAIRVCTDLFYLLVGWLV